MYSIKRAPTQVSCHEGVTAAGLNLGRPLVLTDRKGLFEGYRMMATIGEMAMGVVIGAVEGN